MELGLWLRLLWLFLWLR
uniref:Uncharacterized protein n=1 Tax=Arcella intermedia TaxID=1963864 RepID=A0A6B2LWS5_9EUKA